MNYLAHAYLSFNNPPVLAGNMISDYIKGKKQFDYQPAVQKGIQLHRAIDNFTDTHEATQELKSFFRPYYRLYAGAFADVVYDHFLAKDQQQFPTAKDLEIFAANTYNTLENYTTIFPPPFQQMFPYMKQHNWLYSYQYTWGIERSFSGVARRAAYLSESNRAFEVFTLHYEAMQVCYDNFFPDIKNFSFNKLNELLLG